MSYDDSKGNDDDDHGGYSTCLWDDSRTNTSQTGHERHTSSIFNRLIKFGLFLKAKANQCAAEWLENGWPEKSLK